MKRASFIALLLGLPAIAFGKKKKRTAQSTQTIIISKGVEATEVYPGEFRIIAPDVNGSLTYVANPDLPHDVALSEVRIIVDRLSDL